MNIAGGMGYRHLQHRPVRRPHRCRPRRHRSRPQAGRPDRPGHPRTHPRNDPAMALASALGEAQHLLRELAAITERGTSR
jgi:hypothetical protein